MPYVETSQDLFMDFARTINDVKSFKFDYFEKPFFIDYVNELKRLYGKDFSLVTYDKQIHKDPKFSGFCRFTDKKFLFNGDEFFGNIVYVKNGMISYLMKDYEDDEYFSKDEFFFNYNVYLFKQYYPDDKIIKLNNVNRIGRFFYPRNIFAEFTQNSPDEVDFCFQSKHGYFSLILDVNKKTDFNSLYSFSKAVELLKNSKCIEVNIQKNYSGNNKFSNLIQYL